MIFFDLFYKFTQTQCTVSYCDGTIQGDSTDQVLISNDFINSIYKKHLITHLKIFGRKSPPSVIGPKAFTKFTSITELTVEVGEIGELAFANLTNLVKLDLYSGITKIGSRAFAFTSINNGVNVPESVKEFGLAPFEGTKIKHGIALLNLPENEGFLTGITTLDEITSRGNIYFSRDNGHVIQQSDNKILQSFPLKSQPVPISYEGKDVCEISPYAYANSTFAEVDLSGHTKLTKIGAYAFAHCLQLTKFLFPPAITKVSAYCFLGCINLQTIDLNKFSSLTIEPGAFANCVKLAELNLQNQGGIKVESDKSVTVSSGTELYFVPLTQSTYSVAEGIKKIGAAFWGFTGTSVTLPGSLEEIGENCFRQSNILSINIPGSVQKIGRYAFAYSTQLATINFPSSTAAVVVLDYLCVGCIALSSIVLPKIDPTNSELGPACFDMCNVLSSVSVIKDGDNSFYSTGGILFFSDGSNSAVIFFPRPLTSYTNSGPKTIGHHAFCNSQITTLGLAGVVTISESAFENCPNLAQLNLEEVEQIGVNAFFKTSSIASISYKGDGIALYPNLNYDLFDFIARTVPVTIECTYKFTDFGLHPVVYREVCTTPTPTPEPATPTPATPTPATPTPATPTPETPTPATPTPATPTPATPTPATPTPATPTPATPTPATPTPATPTPATETSSTSMNMGGGGGNNNNNDDIFNNNQDQGEIEKKKKDEEQKKLISIVVPVVVGVVVVVAVLVICALIYKKKKAAKIQNEVDLQDFDTENDNSSKKIIEVQSDAPKAENPLDNQMDDQEPGNFDNSPENEHDNFIINNEDLESGLNQNEINPNEIQNNDVPTENPIDTQPQNPADENFKVKPPTTPKTSPRIGSRQVPRDS